MAVRVWPTVKPIPPPACAHVVVWWVQHCESGKCWVTTRELKDLVNVHVGGARQLHRKLVHAVAGPHGVRVPVHQPCKEQRREAQRSLQLSVVGRGSLVPGRTTLPVASMSTS